jgi:hypothetical protein
MTFGQVLKALFYEKEAKYKSFHALWFYLYDILEKTKYRNRTGVAKSWVCRQKMSPMVQGNILKQ